VAAFLWVDRWEPEPPRLLLLAFMWGAGFAALSALLINSSAVLAADDLLGKGSGDIIGATVSAPFVEEAMKGLFLVGLLLIRRREFDGVVDGIVYAGLVAAGFAFTENILYFGRAFVEQGSVGQSGGVLLVVVLRGIFTPFAHPLFTAMTGIGVGIAAISRKGAVRVLAPLAGYLAAVGLHALWNGSATLSDGGGFLIVYVFVMVPLFVAMVLLVFWQRRREQQVVALQLPGFAQAGWIAQSEVQLLASLAGRRGWRRAVAQQSGPAAARAVRDYQVAVTELAFLRARMARGAVDDQARGWHDELLAELLAARARAVAAPGALRAAYPSSPPGWRPPPPGPPSGTTPGPPPGWQPPRPGPPGSLGSQPWGQSGPASGR
jgi:RsiW-degrading membrane proteinase PrsW (M82 family)